MTLGRRPTLSLVLGALTLSAAPAFGEAEVPAPPSLASRIPASAPGATGTLLRHPPGAPTPRPAVSARSAPPTSVYDFLLLVGVLPAAGAPTSDPCAAHPAAEERGDCVLLMRAGGGGRGPARLMG